MKIVDYHMATHELDGWLIARKNTLAGFSGDITVEKIIFNVNGEGSMLGDVLNFAARKLTNESVELVKISGKGTLYFCDNGNWLKVIRIVPKSMLVVEGINMVAYSSNLTNSVEISVTDVGQKKGLTSTKLANKTDVDGFVTLSSNGHPFLLKAPVCVDPDVILAYAGAPPKIRTDISIKTLIGQASGESYTLEFSSGIVLCQPTERKIPRILMESQETLTTLIEEVKENAGALLQKTAAGIK